MLACELFRVLHLNGSAFCSSLKDKDQSSNGNNLSCRLAISFVLQPLFPARGIRVFMTSELSIDGQNSHSCKLAVTLFVRFGMATNVDKSSLMVMPFEWFKTFAMGIMSPSQIFTLPPELKVDMTLVRMPCSIGPRSGRQR